MSIFRNLQKVVPSSLFAKPNSLILQSRFRPVYLQTGTEPQIEHLHSAKALLNTIQILEKHVSNPTYESEVRTQLQFLTAKTGDYAHYITRFASQGGLLTGQAIGNVYYVAEALNIPAEWLEKYVHNDIPSKYKYMSRQNLIDVLAGLQKHHKSSPYLNLVKEELSKRQKESPIYVNHQYNQSNKYEYAEQNSSNHPLIDVIDSGSSIWKYQIKEAWGRIARGGRYVLHSD